MILKPKRKSLSILILTPPFFSAASTFPNFFPTFFPTCGKKGKRMSYEISEIYHESITIVTTTEINIKPLYVLTEIFFTTSTAIKKTWSLEETLKGHVHYIKLAENGATLTTFTLLLFGCTFIWKCLLAAATYIYVCCAFDNQANYVRKKVVFYWNAYAWKLSLFELQRKAHTTKQKKVGPLAPFLARLLNFNVLVLILVYHILHFR